MVGAEWVYLKGTGRVPRDEGIDQDQFRPVPTTTGDRRSRAGVAREEPSLVPLTGETIQDQG